MISILIIDDEELARSLIKTFLEKRSDVRVVGECDNGFIGVKMIQETNPDLVFLDIQMPKINGFEMLEILDDPRPDIIFSTAYDQHAIKAFEQNAIDYLLKPYSETRFNEALDKAISRISSPHAKQDLTGISDASTSEELKRIVVKNGSRIEIVDVMDILYIKADDDYVDIHTDSQKHIKQVRLKFLEKHLPQGEFVRIHRSFIIRVDQLKKLEHFEKESYVAVLKSGDKIPVSRSGHQKLKEQLQF
ncbi:MAG: LytTR family transcriptional regulator DNA-binding domain-containing protein [Cyclobacteriaceae bacterium]